jgi:hypothetical protein
MITMNHRIKVQQHFITDIFHSMLERSPAQFSANPWKQTTIGVDTFGV